MSADDPAAADDSTESRTGQEDDLRSSLNALARLSSRRLDLNELLTGVAVLAVRARGVSLVNHAGVRRMGRPRPGHLGPGGRPPAGQAR